MKRSILVVFVLVLIAGLCMVGCSSSTTTSSAPAATSTTAAPAPATTSAVPMPSASGKTWKLRFGYEQSTTSYYQLYLWEPWAKEVAKATNGRVTIDLYPAQTLFKSTDATSAVQTGIADMGFVIPAYFPGKYPVIDVVQLPFGASTSNGASQVIWNLYQKYPEVQQMYADFKMVSIWTTQPMYLHSSKKNYKTLDDFKGQQIRASAGAATDMVTGLGGNAVFMGMGDVYINLQKGVVDALITPSEGALGFKIYEVAPYQTHFPGVPAVHSVIMNKKVWNEMPVDVQQAFESVSGLAMCLQAAAAADKASVDMTAKCKEAGVTLYEYTVPDAELARWVEKAGVPMRAAWLKKVQEAGITNGQQILDDTIKLSQQYK
jgi:TRAP-type C4-dicarboxylate transport system substrate-binding protein